MPRERRRGTLRGSHARVTERTRVIVAAAILLLLTGPAAWSQLGPMFQSGVGNIAVATSTPAPTPSPTPNTTVTPGANLETVISSNPGNSVFTMACGIYRAYTDNTDLNAMVPKAGDQFIGCNATGACPPSPTTVPSVPPCVDIYGSMRPTVDGSDSSWHTVAAGSYSSSQPTLYYNVVGLANLLNITTGLKSGGGCESLTGGVAGGTGYGYAMWTASTSYPSGTLIVDANGNVEQSGGGTSKSGNGPAWATAVNGTTTDNTITWTLTTIGAENGYASGPGGCGYPQELFFAATDNDPSSWLLKQRALAWTKGAFQAYEDTQTTTGSWYADFENVGGKGKGTIFVQDNPATSCGGGACTVELTEAQQAFHLTNGNGFLTNVSFAGYSAPIQKGVVQLDSAANTLSYTWGTHSHGGYVQATSGANNVIDHNEVVEMGQEGITTNTSNHTQITNNRWERNNEDNITYGFEVVNKQNDDSSTTVSGNTVQCNLGNGIWMDDSATSDMIINNTIQNNLSNGISVEISHQTTVENNTLTDNAETNACQCIAAHFPILNGQDVCTGKGTMSAAQQRFNGRNEIWLHTSDTATVGASGNGNTVTSNCAGIVINNDGRLDKAGADAAQATCAAGTFYGAACNTIQYNNVTVHNGSAALNQTMGYDSEDSGTNVFAIGNLWDHNSYACDSPKNNFNSGAGPSCLTNTNTQGHYSYWNGTCGNDPHGTNNGC